MKKTVSIISWVLVICAACFAQTSFQGLTPGKSTRADVERAWGQPVNKVSETLYEYAPKAVKTYHPTSCGKIYVQYRNQPAVVERIEVLCERGNCLEMLVQPFQAAIYMFPVPEATTYEGKGTSKEKRIEYFGKAYWAVQTLLVENGNVSNCRLGFYSLELYQAALPKTR